ncbi:probable phytol kinase 1, chloroplastic isoform X3 [Ziziphus jujuba]|uniref:phytol kinase n=1 Tax=Ziziphus jujuba TaxID=326968 RepID=A0A6P3ZSC7_ZIZJJ|nr:probable phytol kinase 1, chloroplastic isoform X3 [Ziziphus jujuba]
MIHLSFTPHHLPTFAILRPPLRLTATASNTTATINILHSFPSSSRLHFLYPPPCRPLRTPLSSFAPPTCAALRASAGDVLHDAGATALVLAGAYVLVFAFNNLTQRNLIHQNSNSNQARCFATLVPLVNCLRLVVHGFQLVDDDGLIKSVTREGNPKELLRGPLYYVLILIICALAFWRESPVGVISLAMMCGGDGIADIVGRKFGSKKIPYNPSKSWAGSISMFVFGFLVSIGMLYYYSALGFMVLDWPLTVQRVALVSMVATFVESLPITKVIDDNISVPLASMVTAFLSFGY